MRTTPFGLLALAMLILAAAPVPLAGAGVADCVSVEAASFAERLAIIAHGGRQVALGFAAPAPGDGVSFVAYISPTLCTGVGLPSPISGTSGASLPTAPATPDAPSYPGLP